MQITETMNKLSNLSQLARRRSPVNDNPHRINSLIHAIKQDIASLHSRIASLSPAAAADGASNPQAQAHKSQILRGLNDRLAHTSTDFKAVLEDRARDMRARTERRETFSSSAAASAVMSDSPLYMAQQQAAGDGGLVHRNTGKEQEQPLLQTSLMIQNEAVDMEIIQSRGQAIESIESTIAELGQIYQVCAVLWRGKVFNHACTQNFAVLLSSQREAVQRIDANVLDTETNVEGAYTQLTRYYQNVSGNRWLIAKVLATMVFFFMLFVVFMN
ncbi:MAG: hypothetical protein SGCHY_005555 [Lobulomycetales sp.]